jgi:hypothetical protein
VNRLIAALVLTAIFTLTSFVQRTDAVVTNPKGYAVQFYATLFGAPADATVYHIGALFTYPPDVAAALTRINLPKAGVIRSVELTCISSTGTAETSTLRLSLNGSDSDVIVSTFTTNTSSTVANRAMNVRVAAGDWVTVKWTTPTWATNPTNIAAMFGVIHVDVP